VLEQVPVDSGTSIVAVVSSLSVPGKESPAELVIAGAPRDVHLALLAVSPGDDGVAAELCEKADLVVTSRASDYAIPAVRSASSSGLVALQDVSEVEETWDRTPSPRRDPKVRMVAVGKQDALTPDMFDEEGVDIFVLHGEGAAEDAVRFLAVPSRWDFELAVIGRPHGSSGAADLSSLNPEILVVHRRATKAVGRWLALAESIGDLVNFAAQPILAHRFRLLVIPGVGAVNYRHSPDMGTNQLPEWIGANGVIPRFASSGNLADIESLRARSMSAQVAPSDIRSWARKHTWTDRWRLVLPWKFGLLERFMRGRW
jgi:hypothetical protein